MKSMLDSADVSIQREDGTQVVTGADRLPPARTVAAGQRETAGSFEVSSTDNGHDDAPSLRKSMTAEAGEVITYGVCAVVVCTAVAAIAGALGY